MSNKDVRDWVIRNLSECNGVVSLNPLGDSFIEINRAFRGRTYPSFTTAIINESRVDLDGLSYLLNGGTKFQFITNIPKEAIWFGDAIEEVQNRALGWGGYGELMSAILTENIAGFQKKEYSFVLRGLQQHSKVIKLDRIFDRVVDIRRKNFLPDIRLLFLNEYELTAERIRHARSIYGKFSMILRSNPNGRATTEAYSVADALGVKIFQWGQLLSRLNRR